MGGAHLAHGAIGGGDGDNMRIDKGSAAGRDFDPVAGKLVEQHLDFMGQRLAHAQCQVGAVDIGVDAVIGAVKAALAPAGEVEHRFAQCL
jgi:hypothetical protein